MKIIGLTGGIASGKSSVSKILQKQGEQVICADEIAHQVINKGGLAYDSVVKEFGDQILDTKKNIDRKKLGPLVFQNPQKLRKLNQAVHPAVISTIQERIQKAKDQNIKRIFLDIPLLFEGETHQICDYIIVVYSPEKVMIERIKLRDGLNDEEIKNRLRSQISIEDKKSKADFVIDNSGSLESTKKQVLNLLESLG